MVAKNKKSLAFTLAEVLITLAIIGVVSALTIPTVVAKYQKQQYYTQFMKMYNTLSNTLEMIVHDYGKPVAMGFSDDSQDEDNIEKAFNILKEYLKTGEEPTSFDGVSGLKMLGQSDSIAPYSELLSDSPYHLVLLDGSIIFVLSACPDEISLVVDTNGIKEPNTYGRDVFMLSYKNKGLFPSLDYNDRTKEECDSENPPTNNSGVACASRLLKEGKMNY